MAIDTLKLSYYSSPAGKMILIGDEKYLYLLEFIGRKNLDKEIDSLGQTNIQEGVTGPILLIKKELDAYFRGTLKTFTTPLFIPGTPFQKKVWAELLNIPFGTTKSYREQACAMGMEKAVRAVANANGKNQFAIVIPCHRVVRANGELGGYGGGLDKKKWLLAHELNC